VKRLEQLFKQLGYTKENGLFYLIDSKEWVNKFPYRISKVLRDIIQPYAFYSLHHHGDIESEHPEPINNPIILFFDKPDDKKKTEIPKWTFCFGQAPVVIINNDDFNALDIYHGYSFESDHSFLLKNLKTDINEFSLINLTLGKTWKNLYAQYFRNVPKVDKYLLRNIIDARRILVAVDGYSLPPKVANRLIGRLLFVRYLIDRRVEFKDQILIVGSDKPTRQASLNELIKNKENLYKFFDYLTARYQGDLFPLKEECYDEESIVTVDHLEVLYHLFSGSSFFRSGSTHKGYLVQPSLFMVYDFEVIPVELISNIYENFIGKEHENTNVKLQSFTKSKQYDIKAYYTPPFIVDYILSQTVTPFLEDQQIASCKVLDPACGSGIFLVETLRKIIEKEIIILQNNNELLTNGRLWQLTKENIFGIDIDGDAIEITIFSLYITLLDYKTPIEIEDFQFQRLKGENLFGGTECDFFNLTSPFNALFTQQVSLDFILGNPPWGIVKTSVYEDYILNRKKNEQKISLGASKLKGPIIFPEIPLEIGNREISQAFLVRISDFASNANLKVGLVVSAKNLYNSDRTSKMWREYFLSNFVLTQVLELSCVNNKIVGGNQIFEEAKMAPAILFYELPKSENHLLKNIVRHITVKPNRFFNYFRTIVIEKHDIKKVLQQKFVSRFGGYDWLWKVMLHGNILDFYFMLRLKSFDSIKEYMYKFDLDFRGGLKIKDGPKEFDTNDIKDYKYLEVESRKEFKQYRLMSSQTWGENVRAKWEKANGSTNRNGRNRIGLEGKVGFLPNIYYFQGQKLLIKKGLEAGDNFKAVAAYSNEDIVFTSTVCAVKPLSGSPHAEQAPYILKNLTGIINSAFFTYYILNTSSSAGVDRTRADYEEIFSAPASDSQELSRLVEKIQGVHGSQNKGAFFTSHDLTKEEEIQTIEYEINNEIKSLFKITTLEQSLIDYSTEIAIPVLKRVEETNYGNIDIFRTLQISSEKDTGF
jgi:hypothetical protein